MFSWLSVNIIYFVVTSKFDFWINSSTIWYFKNNKFMKKKKK